MSSDHSPDSTSKVSVKVTPESKGTSDGDLSNRVTSDHHRRLEVNSLTRSHDSSENSRVKVTPEVTDNDSEDDLILDKDTSTEAHRNKLKRKRGNRSRYCEVSAILF